MICPHKHVEARIWSKSFRDWTIVNSDYVSHPDALICRDCGEWLGLGHSDETDPDVAIEIRAAFIAGLPYRSPTNCSLGELIGWDIRRNNFDRGCTANDGQAAGWLARKIATHSEPQ